MSRSDRCPGCFLEPRIDGDCRRCGYHDDPTLFPSALQPGTTLAKYIIGRVLGRPGGFGITYLAFDTVLHRRLAIKELMPRELVARRPDGETLHVHTQEDGATFRETLVSFLNEARLLAQFSHPHLVRVLDYFEGNGTAYFAMEYYEGHTLAEHVRLAGGRLESAHAVSLMRPILDALEHLHTRSEPILHRDIKPANIYLTANETPILLDFGAARVALGQQSRSLSAVLTPGYAPYEQYSTRGRQGPWSDVYGCAATLYFLVTGRVPRDASDRVDDPHIDDPRVHAPDVPAAVAGAILQGLAFRPEDRPQSIQAFAALLSGHGSVATAGADRGLSDARQATVAPPAIPLAVALADTRTAPAPGDVPLAAMRALEPTLKLPPLPERRPIASLPTTALPMPRLPVRGSSRLPLIVAAAAVLLVVATAWAAGLLRASTQVDPANEESRATSSGDAAVTGASGTALPGTTDPMVSARAARSGETENGATARGETAIAEPARAETAHAEGALPGSSPAPPSSSAGQTRLAPSQGAPQPEPVAAQTAVPPLPSGAATPAPATRGVLVAVRGDDPDGARQAEAAVLRALVGRSGLQAVDTDSLTLMRGDQSAVQAAVQGDFAALAAAGRTHGVELIVVGDLRSRAAPSINRFFTGTAELSVRMYRVSTGRLVDTQTFIVGPGGMQPVLAVSDDEARTRAARNVTAAAAEGVSGWLGRAF